jgi:hypothetical protein
MLRGITEYIFGCCVGSSFSKEVTPLIMNDGMKLSTLQRDTISREFIRLTADTEKIAKRAKIEYDLSWRSVEIGSLLVSAFLVLQHIDTIVSVPLASQLIFWANLCISVYISYKVRTTQRSNLRDRFLMYNEISTTLRSMGYNFFNLTGRYGMYRDHNTAYQFFTADVEAMRLFVMGQENSLTAVSVAPGQPIQPESSTQQHTTSTAIGQSIGASSKMVGLMHHHQRYKDEHDDTVSTEDDTKSGDSEHDESVTKDAIKDIVKDIVKEKDKPVKEKESKEKEVSKDIAKDIAKDLNEVSVAIQSEIPDLSQPLSIGNAFRARIAAALPLVANDAKNIST